MKQIIASIVAPLAILLAAGFFVIGALGRVAEAGIVDGFNWMDDFIN